MFLAGLFFLLFQFLPEKPAEMRSVFLWLVWILIVIVPAISMRLVSEEKRSGTIEAIVTLPISDAALIMGKWLGAMIFFVVLLLPTLCFPAVLEIWANPDYGPIMTGYVGLLLVGSLYLAIGTFASVLTRNQIIAFLVSVFIILMLTVIPFFLPRFLSPNMAEVVLYINVNHQYDDFAKGIIDTSDLVYFISTTVMFLVLAVKALESRRWQ